VNIFQLITLPIVFVLFAISFARLIRYRRLWNGFWVVLWVAAGVAIAYPKVTQDIATTLGITRGVDLVLYLSVLLTGVGFFMLYTHLQRVEMQLTTLVRQIGIQQAIAEQRNAPAGPESKV